MIYFKIGIILFLLYLGWSLTLLVLHLSKRSPVRLNIDTFMFFDTLLKGLLLGLVFARFVWIFEHFEYVKKMGWWYLPYVREAGGISWFKHYPWRFIDITEGISVLALKYILLIYVFVVWIFRILKYLLSIKVRQETLRILAIVLWILWYILFALFVLLFHIF